MTVMREGPYSIVEVRCCGWRTFEARADGGRFAAIGSSQDDSVRNLREQHPFLRPDGVRLIQTPYLPEEFDLNPEDELEGGH